MMIPRSGIHNLEGTKTKISLEMKLFLNAEWIVFDVWVTGIIFSHWLHHTARSQCTVVNNTLLCTEKKVCWDYSI